MVDGFFEVVGRWALFVRFFVVCFSIMGRTGQHIKPFHLMCSFLRSTQLCKLPGSIECIIPITHADNSMNNDLIITRDCFQQCNILPSNYPPWFHPSLGHPKARIPYRIVPCCVTPKLNGVYRTTITEKNKKRRTVFCQIQTALARATPGYF